MHNDVKKILKENKFLIDEVKIDNSSLGLLVYEAKLNAIKKAQWALLAREIEKKARELAAKRDNLIAKLTERITKKAEEDGRPIASSAVKDLQKTKIPLFPEYRQLNKLLYEAEADSRFAMRIYRIMEERGRTIELLLKIDKDLVMKEKLALSDSEAMIHREEIMKSKIAKMVKKYTKKEKGGFNVQ